jgi:ABC-type antimicrobial peptide transport system permease subunit
MRALGMSFKDVYEMILWEQVLLCLASVVIGIFSGLLAGALFAPLLQSAFGQMGQMPPYEVAFSFVDIIKLIILTIVLIGVSLGAGTIMLKRIKAATAIKLGEE